MSVQFTRHPFTIDEYHAVAAAGGFKPDARVELVEGDIVDMTPIGSRHAAAVDILNRWLVIGCGGRAIIRVQGPLRIGSRSELQPDVMALRPADDFYRDQPATAADVLLLVEVADSSLLYDRSVKVPLYARAGVPEVWIVDLTRGEIQMCSEPGADGFQRIEARGRGDEVRPFAFVDLALAVNTLLG
jgi:Uma2 family endonuclease